MNVHMMRDRKGIRERSLSLSLSYAFSRERKRERGREKEILRENKFETVDIGYDNDAATPVPL